MPIDNILIKKLLILGSAVGIVGSAGAGLYYSLKKKEEEVSQENQQEHVEEAKSLNPRGIHVGVGTQDSDMETIPIADENGDDES